MRSIVAPRRSPASELANSALWLLSIFLWGHPINPEGAGSWSWSRSWPNAVRGFYRIQIATIGPGPQGNGEVSLTDCVIAECTQ